MYELPRLYKLDSKNKKRVFIVTVLDDTLSSYTTKTGLVDGALIERTYTPTPKGKNTALEQAKKDAQSKWNKKYNRELYSTDLSIPHPSAFTQPVLAKDYLKVPHQLDWSRNWVAPRKLNGVRCTIKYAGTKDVILTSKKGKIYKVPHIQKSLYDQVYNKPENKNLEFDGELYIHGVELGDVTHAVAHAADHPELQYHAFDHVEEGTTFRERYNKVEQLKLHSSLALVRHLPIRNEADMIAAHDKYVLEGYEGTMIRDLDFIYEKGTRSLGLFKRKAFIDSEFDIIDVTQDSDGGAILILQTKNGIKFNSRPIGTNEQRLRMYINRAFIIGKQATARYSTLLISGVPEFNRTIAIRDYE